MLILWARWYSGRVRMVVMILFAVVVSMLVSEYLLGSIER